MPNGFSFKNFLTCAGRRTGGVSVCKGDSGGGLLRSNAGITNGKRRHYYQIGITQGTYNTGCEVVGVERYPSIFTRTENLNVYNFIQRTIGLTG